MDRPVTSHTFRKTAATIWHDSGVLTDRQMADPTGHAKISALRDIYVPRGELRQAHDSVPGAVARHRVWLLRAVPQILVVLPARRRQLLQEPPPPLLRALEDGTRKADTLIRHTRAPLVFADRVLPGCSVRRCLLR